MNDSTSWSRNVRRALGVAAALFVAALLLPQPQAYG